MLLSRLVCLHIRPPPTSTPFPYTTLFRSIGMGVRTVDRGPGAGVAGAAPPVGAVGAAVPRREEHVGARRDEGAGDLIERMVGIGAVILRRADRGVARAVEQPPAVVDYPPPRRAVYPLH